MVDLDYILYIIIIVLLCILINKVYDKNGKEGFEHRGNAIIASTKKIESVIESAEYGYFNIDEWSDVTGFKTSKFKRKNVLDIKPALDNLIKKKTKEIVVGSGTFDVIDPAPGLPNFLIVKFSKPVVVTDAIGQMPYYTKEMGASNALISLSGAYVWKDGDSMSLKFANYQPDPFWFDSGKAFYKIAELFAYITIKMPYQFLNQLANLAVTFMENIREIFAPIFDFIDQMRKLAEKVIRYYIDVFKWGFEQFAAIMKDIPGFLKAQLNNFINFIQDVLTKTFNLLQMFFDLFMKMFNTLIQLPMQLFSMIEQLGTIMANLFTILINIPTAALNMIIAFQTITIDAMAKTPTVPFMDMFLK
jgi:hypothetical protein